MSALTGLYAWGKSIDEILWYWQDIGVFRYALPFLLIFAMVFGILTKSRIFGENKGVNVVIALAVGLLALQFEFVPEFFSTIFPYAGIGIAAILVGLILTGLFHSDKNWWSYIFFGLGMLTAVIVVLSSLSSYEWGGGWWWQESWEAIVTFGILIGLMLLVILATRSEGGK